MLNPEFDDTIFQKEKQNGNVTAEKLKNGIVKDVEDANNATCHPPELDLDISTAPGIPEQVYQTLPEILSQPCSYIDKGHRRDVFFVAALPAVSSQMPNVLTAHRDKYYTPDIFTQIVAGPGSGKGGASKSKQLAKVTDKYIRENADLAIQNWEMKPDEEKAQTEQPKKQSLFIPANASSRKIYDRLEANGGNGFIFESEIDTLINANSQEWGNYTDTVRKAFHHEDLSIIRKDGEFYIDSPRLSICLTGTFDQFKEMFQSAENGHFSRYALFTFDAPRQWRSHRPTKNSQHLDQCIEQVANMLHQMYKELKLRSDPIYVKLTADQWQRIDDTFSEKMKLIERLDLSPHLHATNNRAGVIAPRIATIFTILRAANDDINKLRSLNSIQPQDKDVDAAITLTDTFIDHAFRLYHILPESSPSDPKGERHKIFLAQLPDEFETAEAIEIGKKNEIPERTVKRWLSNDEKINRIKRGKYELA